MFGAIKRWWRWNKPVVYREGKHWHDMQQQRIAYATEISDTIWKQIKEAEDERNGTTKRGRHSR